MPHFPSIRLAATLAACLALVSGVSGQTQQQGPAPPRVQAPPANPQPADPSNPTVPVPNTDKNATVHPAGVGVDIHSYIIGAEDLLFIQVWREPDFTRQVVVRPDGKFSLPLIGEVQAAGLTPEQCSKSLHESLSKLINNPDVSISVLAVNSKRYYIDGEVFRPGLYRLVTPTTILEALSEAGGFRDFANPKKIRVLRGSNTYKFNYKEVIRGKNMSQNIYLQNGDHIIVP